LIILKNIKLYFTKAYFIEAKPMIYNKKIRKNIAKKAIILTKKVK
jgi:hypothetical protein